MSNETVLVGRFDTTSRPMASPWCRFVALQAHDACDFLQCGIRTRCSQPFGLAFASGICDTPARGFGRSSLAVGQWVFLVLLSHSRRYDRAGLGAVVFGGV